MMKLSKDEKEDARIWRINKCGFDSFDVLVDKFTQEMKKDED